MDYFWVGPWEHAAPEETCKADGRRGIIRHLCFGPLETSIYGVTRDSRYYFENHIMEGLQEGDIFFEYIDQGQILKAISDEINLCNEYHANGLKPLLEKEKEEIEKAAMIKQ